MSIKIIYEKENPLFSRKEIIAEINNETSPKRTEMEAVLSEKFSVTPEEIKISRIIPKFGSDIFTIYARIYKSKDEKENIEPKPKAPKTVK